MLNPIILTWPLNCERIGHEKSPGFSLVLFLLAAPTFVEAQSGSGDGYNYTINPANTNTITIDAYIGFDFTPVPAVVIIPTNIDNLLVTGIGDGEDSVFGQNGVTSVVIPASVTTIGEQAFYDSGTLTNILIPPTVVNIAAGTFFGTGLASITIPDGVTNIGDYAFSDCSRLSFVQIPSSVTTIGSDAFSNCGILTNVAISEGVTNIGDGAFAQCYSLAMITIPGSALSIGDGAFFRCSGLKNVTMSNGITSIEDNAFAFCSQLTNVIIPATLTNIGADAFGETDLITVNIPGKVNTIGQAPFTGCPSLTAITVDPQNLFYSSTEWSFVRPEPIHSHSIPCRSGWKLHRSRNSYQGRSCRFFGLWPDQCHPSSRRYHHRRRCFC